MGTRDERVDDLFFQAVSGEPTEEGQTRRVSTDIRTFIGGLARSLLAPRAWKDPVVVATTGPITLSGLQTIDGIALSSGDRVLVKNQSTGSENGIRIAAVGAWLRSNDFDLDDDLITGMMVPVQRGTANGGKVFRLSTTGTMTLDTTSLAFDVFPPAGGGSGDVVGPASSTNNGIARFDGVTGKLLKSGVSPQIDDSGNLNMGNQQITNVSQLSVANFTVPTGGSINFQTGSFPDFGGVGIANVGSIRYTTTNAVPGANQNNYNPTGFATCNILRLAPTADSTITGFLAGAGSGGSEVILVVNASAFNITLVHESASSSAANRMAIPQNRNMILGPGRSCKIYYDVTSSRWRIISGTGARRSFTFVVNSDVTVTTGAKPKTIVRSPFAGVITGWSLSANVATTAKVDVWKAAGVIPTNTDSITASDKPTLDSAVTATSTALTGWTTTIAEGDVLEIEVEDNIGAAHLCLVLDVEVL